MPKNDRRNAHCYALTRDKIRLGWWERQQFRTVAARLRDLSVSGALIELEEGAAFPAGVKTWICLAGQSPPNWVQAESKTVEDCKDIPGTSRVLRLKFLDTFPYESFKTAVWDDGAVERKPSPGAGDSPLPCGDEGSAKSTNLVRMTKSEHTGIFSQLDPPTATSSGREPEIAAVSSPHPPTLVEAYRSQMVFARASASLPWLAVLLISLFVSVLLGLLSRSHMISLGKLAILLGLTESN